LRDVATEPQAMRRPPFAVVVAAIMTGLQGVLVLLLTGFLFLWAFGWERDGPVPYSARMMLAGLALFGVLIIVAAIMVLSGSYRWAVAVAVFEGLLAGLQLVLSVRDLLDRGSYVSTLSGATLIALLANLVPFVCLVLPSSRRWSRERATRAALTTGGPFPPRQPPSRWPPPPGWPPSSG
jgi:hypothetical protein